MSNTETLQKLYKSYSDLKSLYSNIYNTYEVQREAFKNEDEEQMQVLIEQRSKLMDQVDQLTKHITQIKTEIGEEISSNEEIDELRHSIKDILQKTIELDQKLTEEMQLALGENRQKRQGLQQGKKVFNAYNANQAAALFMDRKK